MQLIAEKRTYTKDVASHSHHHAHVIMPLQGELFVIMEENTTSVSAQSLLFVPPNAFHSFYAKTQNEFLVLDIPDILLSSATQTQAISYAFSPQWQALRSLILYELQQGGKTLRALYPYISQCLQREQSPSIRYIHEHYDETLSIQQLADLEHYSRTYYTEWFIKQTGKTPAHYIRDVRLTRAKELLQYTSFSLLAIAIQVGLSHQSALTRLFQQYEGMTPSEFRKKHTLC